MESIIKEEMIAQAHDLPEYFSYLMYKENSNPDYMRGPYTTAEKDLEYFMIYAVEKRLFRVVKELFELGVSVNIQDSQGRTLTAIAEKSGSLEILNFILESNIAAQSDQMRDEAREILGFNFLRYARDQAADFFDFLLPLGADLEPGPDTELMVALIYNDQTQEATERSREEAEKKGEIGPREIVGFTLKEVEDEGNCFYLAIANQMNLNNYRYSEIIPSGTEMHNSLRLAVQGENFSDRQWADDAAFDSFVREFPDIILAIIDTRNPNAGFTLYYAENDGTITTNTGDGDFAVPNDRVIIRIAATGNHFLSVISHLNLENGAITGEWSSSNQQQGSRIYDAHDSYVQFNASIDNNQFQGNDNNGAQFHGIVSVEDADYCLVTLPK